MDGLLAIIGVFSFCLGATIGSFLNVVIWRVPRGESIVRPSSHCPKCGTGIRWYQNIPILSWLALRGKCANCRAPISPRYIIVELLTGCLFLAAFLHSSGVTVTDVAPDGTLVATQTITIPLVPWIWIALMIIGSFIDYDLKLLPDFVTIGGMILGLIAGAVMSVWTFVACPSATLLQCANPLVYSVVGLAFGFGLLWLIRYLGSKAFKREAMGMGDVLLMGAVGAIFGPVAVLVTLILSAVAGSIVGVGMILLSKTKLGSFAEIPYGPYICLGCLAWMFWGPKLVNWYMNLLVPIL